MASKSAWYRDGVEVGRAVARNVLREKGGLKELRDAARKHDIGEIIEQIRGHQVQFAGDISYDVGRSGGPTER